MRAGIMDTTVTIGRPFTTWAGIMGTERSLMGSRITFTMRAVIKSRGWNTAMGRCRRIILFLIPFILGPRACGVHRWITPRRLSVSRRWALGEDVRLALRTPGDEWRLIGKEPMSTTDSLLARARALSLSHNAGRGRHEYRCNLLA
jgi:hypothetical protein